MLNEKIMKKIFCVAILVCLVGIMCSGCSAKSQESKQTNQETNNPRNKKTKNKKKKETISSLNAKVKVAEKIVEKVNDSVDIIPSLSLKFDVKDRCKFYARPLSKFYKNLYKDMIVNHVSKVSPTIKEGIKLTLSPACYDMLINVFSLSSFADKVLFQREKCQFFIGTKCVIGLIFELDDQYICDNDGLKYIDPYMFFLVYDQVEKFINLKKDFYSNLIKNTTTENNDLVNEIMQITQKWRDTFLAQCSECKHGYDGSTTQIDNLFKQHANFNYNEICEMKQFVNCLQCRSIIHAKCVHKSGKCSKCLNN